MLWCLKHQISKTGDCGLTEFRHLTEIYGGSSLQLIEFHGARVSSYGSQFDSCFIKKVRIETINHGRDSIIVSINNKGFKITLHPHPHDS